MCSQSSFPNPKPRFFCVIKIEVRKETETSVRSKDAIVDYRAHGLISVYSLLALFYYHPTINPLLETSTPILHVPTGQLPLITLHY